ncbi:MAG TPA: RDD family protein [Steroidobacteraceae bacterium]
MNSAIDTIVTAETPEGISIPIRPAGFAVRATAFLVDVLIRIALFSVCASLFSMGRKVGVGLFFISAFAINWLYPVLFEMSAAAATPGKRIFGLYVLMANGLPITPAGCLIRNLLRVVDMLPLLYAFAIVAVLLRRDSRRLGDLAAGTVVAYRQEVEIARTLADGIPIPPPTPLTRRQEHALTAFAWRVDRLTAERAEEIASHAASVAPSRAAHAAPTDTPLADRLIGIARWLHGERPAAARPPEGERAPAAAAGSSP